jgi:phosphotriesterase-related protein
MSAAAATVATVGGPVEADRLGTTLMHEHQRIAAATPVNIVVATGIYTYGDVPFWFHERRPARGRPETDPMVDFFVGDITVGVAGTGVRAGILKCATAERGLTPDVERILRAVAPAHRATGVPVTTHSVAALRNGLDQQRVFADEGVNLARVIIGHSGDTSDLDYLRRLMDAGSTIGMDRFGIDTLLPFEDRVATVGALCREGYADRMVLSHDASCWLDWFDPDRGEQLRALLPRWHYRHIHEDVLPALEKRGVGPEDLRTMLVETPAASSSPSGPTSPTGGSATRRRSSVLWSRTCHMRRFVTRKPPRAPIRPPVSPTRAAASPP